jgi:hypothetical protein
MRSWWSRSARREVFFRSSWCALSDGPSRGVGVGCPLRELSPAASPCGSRHRAALQRRLLRPLPQKTSHASPSRPAGARTPSRCVSSLSRACECADLTRSHSASAHALRAASECRPGLYGDRGFARVARHEAACRYALCGKEGDGVLVGDDPRATIGASTPSKSARSPVPLQSLGPLTSESPEPKRIPSPD